MKGFGFCLKKDFKECIRRYRLIIFFACAFGIMILVYAASLILPGMFDAVMMVMPDLFSVGDSMGNLMEALFPKNVRDSISLLSSNLLVFYLVVVVIMCSTLLPGEYKNGKWNMPLTSGYGFGALVWSKGIVYSLSAAAPIFLTFVSYYWLIAGRLNDNFGFTNALLHALIAALCVMAVALATIFGSAITKHGFLNLILNIAVFLFCPDIFAFFSFGKFLPTYAIEFSKMGYVTYSEVWIPLALLLICCVLLGVCSVRKVKKSVH